MITKFYVCDGKKKCGTSKNCQIHNPTGQCRYTADKKHAVIGGASITVDNKVIKVKEAGEK